MNRNPSYLFVHLYIPGFLCKTTVLFLILQLATACNSEGSTGRSQYGDSIHFIASYGSGDYTDAGVYAIQTRDSGFVFMGLTSTFPIGQQGLLVVKTDKYGNTEWGKSYGTGATEEGSSILETANHDYVICGHSSLYGVEDHDINFMRISNTGELLWSKMIGGSDYDYGTDILELPDGSLILAGYSYSYGHGNDDLFLSKFTAGGDSLWTKIYGGTLNEHGYSVDHTADNGFIMTGFTKSFNNEFYDHDSLLTGFDPNVDYYDVYIIKTDSLGDTLWTRTMGKADHDRGQSVMETAEGDYVIAGHSYSFGDQCDVLLMKVSREGDLLWSKVYSNPLIDAAYSVDIMTDGGFLIAGETAYMNDTLNAVAGLLIRTDQNGDTLWTKAIATPGGITVLYYAGKAFNGGHFATGKTIPAAGDAFTPILLSLNSEGNTSDRLPSARITIKNVTLDVHYTNTVVGSGLDFREHTMKQIDANCLVHYFVAGKDSASHWGITFH